MYELRTETVPSDYWHFDALEAALDMARLRGELNALRERFEMLRRLTGAM